MAMDRNAGASPLPPLPLPLLKLLLLPLQLLQQLPVPAASASTEADPSAPLRLPPVKTEVQIVAFHGDQGHYNISAPHMRWTGHAGLRYRARPDRIYGFTPLTPLLGDMGRLVAMLLEGEPFPGFVDDDMAEFVDAAQSPFGVFLVFWDVPPKLCAFPDCGLSRVLADAGPGSELLYAFPPVAPRALARVDHSACDETWNRACFNCGTYPRSVGVPIPEESGMFHEYIPALASREGAHCRCYLRGEWLEPRMCLVSTAEGVFHPTWCESDCPDASSKNMQPYAKIVQKIFDSCGFDKPRN